jgi:DNA-directed RNA polymerase specialized sigma24 family protein
MAAHLDEPLGTLLARHHRALAKLRALLEGGPGGGAGEGHR